MGFLSCLVPLERRSERVRGKEHVPVCVREHTHLANEVKPLNRPKLAGLVGMAVIGNIMNTYSSTVSEFRRTCVQHK